jgi:hypothetical protein
MDDHSIALDTTNESTCYNNNGLDDDQYNHYEDVKEYAISRSIRDEEEYIILSPDTESTIPPKCAP